MIRRTVSAILFLALFTSATLIAQTFRGGVGGTLSDSTGSPVAGAPVKLVSPDTGLTRTGVTSSSGEFIFQDLPLGQYGITVTQPGFESIHVTGINVDAGKISNLALKLEVAKQATTVEVTASTVSLDTASSAETSLIDTKQDPRHSP